MQTDAGIRGPKAEMRDTALVSSLMRPSLIFSLHCPLELAGVLTLLRWGQGQDVVS